MLIGALQSDRKLGKTQWDIADQDLATFQSVLTGVIYISVFCILCFVPSPVPATLGHMESRSHQFPNCFDILEKCAADAYLIVACILYTLCSR